MDTSTATGGVRPWGKRARLHTEPFLPGSRLIFRVSGDSGQGNLGDMRQQGNHVEPTTTAHVIRSHNAGRRPPMRIDVRFPVRLYIVLSLLVLGPLS